MELAINDRICELKDLNQHRRLFFVSKVLSFYNYESSNFKEHLKATQKVLSEKHSIEMSLEKVETNFFKHYSKSVKESLWLFLKTEDKTVFKSIDNLKLEDNQLKTFIEYTSNKIKQYCSYINKQKGKATSEDIYSIYSYVSKVYGWSFEQIKEMDELELMKSIEHGIELVERENANSVNLQALAGAFVGGSKKAKSQIDSMNKKITTKDTTKKMANVVPTQSSVTRDQIINIMESSNGR
jgi:hypothetical protein